MTNDLTTLSGALLEMKDQLVYELGQKGVTASYSSSDGLLGLIGKISEIQTGGGSTIIFEDACNSSSGLSNYTFQEIESGTCTGTIEYDSTMNAYKMTSTSGGVKMWCINDLNGLTQFKLTMELYLPSSNVNDSAVSVEVATTTQSSVGLYIEKSSTKLHYHRFQNSTWKENMVLASTGGSKDTWLKVEMTINGVSLNTKVYNGDTQLLNSDYTLTNTSGDYNTDANRSYGVGVGWSNGAVGYVRNIKAESLGGGSTVIFEDDATSDNSSTIFGSYISLRNSGTASVTYTTGSPNYYLLANTRANAEAFIPYSLLNGLTDSFKITVKSAIDSTTYNACLIGLYYYEDDNNWGGIKGSIHEQWISAKTNGTFTETQYPTGKSYSTEILTTELVYNSNDNTLSITAYDSSNVLIQSETMNIPITLSSNVRWGTTTTWSSNDKHRVYEIKAEYLDTPTSISLSSNKNIISYYDSESATLTATYQSGATMELWNMNTMTKIGNFTDNNDGTYTYTYNSSGVGDISLIAKVGLIKSDPLIIEDCLFYGINTNAFTIPSNTTFESDGEKIYVTTSTSGEKIVYFNHDFNEDDDFLFEIELAEVGQTQAIGMAWNDVAQYGGQWSSSNEVYAHLTNSDVRISHTLAIGDKYTVIKENGTTYAFINDTLISSAEPTYNSTFKVGFFVNRYRTQYYKNIKIKPVTLYFTK